MKGGERDVLESRSERERECYLKNEEKERESESCVLSLVVWFSSQPGSLAERERESRGGGGKENERERKWECERDRERGVSFSSVWPLSHSNSGLAT